MKTMQTSLLLFTIASMLASANGAWAVTEQVLHYFDSFSGDGNTPAAPLVRDAAGNIFGTTYLGGDFNAGTVFELSPIQGGGWNYCIIHSFAGGNDGAGPEFARLAIDATGNLYGTTVNGGNNGTGNGVVYELSSPPPGQCQRWPEKILHTFTGNGAGSKDGGFPEGGVILDGQGNLLGTTAFGGSQGLGRVFELSPTPNGWIETVIHDFLGDGPGKNDGANPRGNLAMDRQGHVYGFGLFTNVFRLSRNSKTGKWSYKSIYTVFSNPPLEPAGGLAVDSLSRIYGTSQYGPNPKDYGTVFQLANFGGVWEPKFLHEFQGGSDGTTPVAGATVDPAGKNLYGTTFDGGKNGLGSVYSLPVGGGRLNTIYSFVGGLGDGSHPISSEPIVDSAGNVYGTTESGGPAQAGTVYEVSP